MYFMFFNPDDGKESDGSIPYFKYFFGKKLSKVPSLHPIFNMFDALGRTFLVKCGIGGYFPPHRDLPIYTEKQRSLRILVPLKNCNPPEMYFIYDDKTLNFEHGRAYFVNTNKMHLLFSFTGSSMIVINVAANEESYTIIGKHFQCK